MALSSQGAHVKIGTYQYTLDKSKPEPYKHRFESLFSQTTAIAGEIAKQQLRPEKMLWYMTDWSGGEGFKIYYPTEPTRYDQGSLMNVTQRGLITTRARRRRSSVARASATSTTAFRPAGGSAWNKAMIFWGDDVLYSLDAVGWTATTGAVGTAGYHFFDCSTDGRYLVPGIIKEGTSTTDVMIVTDASLITPTSVDAFTGTTVMNPPTTFAVMEGVPYIWTLQVGTLILQKGAAINSIGAGGGVIYSAGFIPTGVWGTNYWTDLEAADNALYFSLGTPNGSIVFESRGDVGRPFWTGPMGFTIKKLVYHAGVLFCIGSQVASGKKFAAMWAIPLATRAPIFIAAPRRHRNTELFEWTIACQGYGNTIFLADENSGKIFIYDIDQDAISLFDDLANGGTGDGTSFTATGGPELMAPLQQSLAGGSIALNGWVLTSGTGQLDGSSFGHGSNLANCFMNSTGATVVWNTLTGTKGIPVVGSTAYAFSGWFESVGGANGTTQFQIQWYDSTGASISTSSDSAQNNTGSYQQRIYSATSPSNAAFASCQVTQVKGANSCVIDDFSFKQGAGTTTDKLAFLAMHGSRLFGATFQPDLGTGTSLQVLTWDDTLKENRDDSQAISATIDSAEWDFGVPNELKALNGVYVTYEITDNATTSGLLANSRITISYATDANIFTDSYTALTTITSATAVTNKGRHYIQVSDGSSTVKFSRIKFRITLDNNSTAVAPPILYSAVAEAQLLAYSEVWDLIVRVQDEADNERPAQRQWRAHQLMDNLEDLAQNKNYVTFLDGIRYEKDNNRYTTHIVQVEDPQFVIEDTDTGEGYCQVRLRSVPS